MLAERERRRTLPGSTGRGKRRKVTSMPAALSLSVSVERWPIAGSFVIARGSKTEATVVVAKSN